MKAVAAYMAYRNRENENDRRNEYHDPGRREYENRSEYGGQRQPNQYPQRNEMGGYWPENNDQRGGGNGRGREMNDYGGAESRYRGRDGRWRAGRRRSEYDGGAYDNYPMDRRMGDDEDDDEEEERKKYSVTVQPKNVIEWPYGPGQEMPPESRVIGFGTRDREYQTRSHYGERMNEGRENWMANEPQEHGGMIMLDRDTAERWVRTMRNEDSARPTGARWSMDELKPMAQKFGIKPDSEEFIEFFAMTNAMYSDYCGVAKKFNITSPEFYGLMALAWMRDKDAVPNKTAMYYECCVKK